MNQKTWDSLTPLERAARVDRSGLTQALVGLEGWRVEVEDEHGEVRRFIVGKSTGWRPCHLELHNRRSLGGVPAEKAYRSVRKIERVRQSKDQREVGS